MEKQIKTDHKIVSLEQAIAACASWKSEGMKVVFTNGCFDILHRGHIQYLTAAKSLGNKLIVGLNSDDSIRLLEKGDSRPLQDEKSRASVLAALSCIDMIILFDEFTPLNLITSLLPDILVKGGDYKKEEVVGYQEVNDKGGETIILEFLPGYSTTSIEQKIIQAHGKG